MSSSQTTKENAPRTRALYDDRIGAILDGRYRVLSPLGDGLITRSYSGEHVNLDSKLVISFLKEECVLNQKLVDNFLERAKYQSQINSPHTVRIFDFGTNERDEPYVVAEYAQGDTLSEYMAKKGPLPPSKAARLLHDLAALLFDLELEGKTHGNLKPSNIKISEKDEGYIFKLMDFGVIRNLPIKMAQKNTWNLWLTTKVGDNDCKALGLYAFYLLKGTLPKPTDHTIILDNLTPDEGYWFERLNSLFIIGGKLRKNEHSTIVPVVELLEYPDKKRRDKKAAGTERVMGTTWWDRLLNNRRPLIILALAALATTVIVAFGAYFLRQQRTLQIHKQGGVLPKERVPSVDNTQEKPAQHLPGPNQHPFIQMKRSYKQRKGPNNTLSATPKGTEFYLNIQPSDATITVSGAKKVEGNLYRLNTKGGSLTVTGHHRGYKSRRFIHHPVSGQVIHVILKKQPLAKPPIHIMETQTDELINPFNDTQPPSKP